jgi:serine/threonine-protein kinase HipA
MPTLNILMGGMPVATLHKLQTGKLALEYHDQWMRSRQSFPISFSLPLTARDHQGRSVENFLWNLLPDNTDTLRAWANAYGVSANSVFQLLEKVGEDCAGAIQIVSDEWLEQNSDPRSGSVDWIDEDEVAARLKRLSEDRTWTGRRPGDKGHFSLAGAQPKMALLEVDGRWGVPSGRIATTHILKPPLPHLQGTTENEHACLQLAARLGMIAAESRVGHFGDQVAIVVTRYDRDRDDQGVVRRYHQEDLCQALNVHPANKYQNQGGPSAEKIATLLAQTTEPKDAQDRFLRALVLNFLIGGTDAHAKNFSILHLSGRRSFLAPLYDVISYDPYVDDAAEFRSLKMAMKIGHYEFEDVMPRHWEAFSGACGMQPEEVVEIVRSYASAIPDEMSAVVEECRQHGLEHEVLNRMVDRLASRCTRILRIYGSARSMLSM